MNKGFISSQPIFAKEGFKKRLLAGMLLFNLIVIALVTLSLSRSHQLHTEHVELIAQNLVSAFEDSIDNVLHRVDLSLIVATHEIERQIASGKPNAEAISNYLKRLHSHLPMVRGIRASDEHGWLEYGANIPDDAKISISEREYFSWLRNNPDSGLVVSKPVISHIDKIWCIILARRINHPDGRFAGVIYANIPLEEFGKLFSSVDIGKLGKAYLWNREMELIVSHPTPQDIASLIGQKSFLEPPKQSNSTHGASIFHAPDSIISYRKVDIHPLVVGVSLAESEFVEDYRREAWQMSIALLCFVLSSAIGYWLLTRIWGRQQEATDKLHAIVETALDAVVTMDGGGIITGWNAQAEAIFGWPGKEAIGRALHETIIPLRYREAHIQGMRRFLSSGVGAVMNSRIEIFALHRDGHEFPVELAITQVKTGSAYEFSGFVRDITGRKRAEEEIRRLNQDLERRVEQRTALLEAANRELEEFSYSISHDMRTPLRAIDGYAAILLDEHDSKLDEEGRRLLKVVRDNAQRMGIQIDAILHFLRMGKRTMEYGPIDMDKLAREVFAELRAATPARRLRLDIGKLPAAWGDHDMVRQVLANLLSNAVKFSAADAEAVVELSGAEAEKENVYAIRDHGTGFDMQYVNKLFKVFERVHPTGQYEGAGIGLALAKRIVERHGGRVWAQGEVGKGATFYFALPHKEDNMRDQPDAAPHQIPPGTPAPCR